MVECESTSRWETMLKITVLIDTWWNVNNFMQSQNIFVDNVLIDTWWNVNKLVWRDTLI